MGDWIELTDFAVDAVVGITDPEQRTVQPLSFAIRMEADLSVAADEGRMDATVDYAAVQAQVSFLAQYGRWRLIESLGYAVARLLLAPPAPAEERAAVDVAEVQIRKPQVLVGAVPGVGVRKRADDVDLQTRMIPPKLWLDVLCELPDVGAYRAHLEPGAPWEVPAGTAVMLLAGGCRAEGVVLARGAALPMGGAGNLEAFGDVPATLLVVSRPPLED